MVSTLQQKETNEHIGSGNRIRLFAVSKKHAFPEMLGITPQDKRVDEAILSKCI